MNKLFNKKKHTKNRILKFLSLFSEYRKDKKKLRNLEMQLLQPDPIPKYEGQKATQNLFKKRSIIVSMPNSKHIEQWARHFRINKHVDNNTWDTAFLIELFNLLDSGRVAWDKKTKKYKLKTKDGRKITI